MHQYTLQQWQHSHEFVGGSEKNERSTLRVVLLTLSMMVIEIGAGWLFGSMALLADGWHMGTHAGALGIALFAYVYARKHSHDRRYTFGTGKVSVLGGFSSAIVLLVVALLMAVESIQRFFAPQAILFNEAIFVAGLGLVVNLVSALLLQTHPEHHHDHNHDHDHDRDHAHEAGEPNERQSHDHQDHNLKAAYLHVLADALTSVLAILALLTGKAFGWIWMDAVMGIVGAVVISRWSLGLLRDTSRILLDASIEGGQEKMIRAALEGDADNRVSDLHLWWVGPAKYAALVSIVTHCPQPVDHYRGLLRRFDDLTHVTVEVNACSGEPCIPVNPNP